MVAGRFLVLLDLLDPRFDSPCPPIFFTEIKNKRCENSGSGAGGSGSDRKYRSKEKKRRERSYVPIANHQSTGG